MAGETHNRKLVSGDDLMLFDGKGKSIGFATSQSLSISVDLETISHKDVGIWNDATPGKINWEITTENLYSQVDYDDLFVAMTNKKALTVWFGLKDGHENDGQDYVQGATVNITQDGTWSPDSTASLYTGKVYLTSLEVSAATGEKATFSCTFTGSGSITHATYSASSDSNDKIITN